MDYHTRDGLQGQQPEVGLLDLQIRMLCTYVLVCQRLLKSDRDLATDTYMTD